ncbi:50S ribosomal protein L23 [Candidatus Roizmanbacteria bacterium]|nr:50S ribosomal protein L23 [Candidatus Roizmanbacteria bacterium]
MITKAIIRKPVLTEKATQLAQKAVYLFEVDSTARKTQVAKAVQELYKVQVETVRILVRVGKTRRVGKTGKTIQLPDTKRAYVVLKSGKIDVFPQA